MGYLVQNEQYIQINIQKTKCDCLVVEDHMMKVMALRLGNGLSRAMVTYIGEYKNGEKVARWDIFYRDRETKLNEQIGGGSYKEGGLGMKIGKWIEQSDGFQRDPQVTNNGEYKNGKKVGRQDTCLIERAYCMVQIQKKCNNIINSDNLSGGGLYDEGGCQVKIGRWIELSDKFQKGQKIIYTGEYQDNKKVGTWIEMDINKNENSKKIIYDQ